MDKFTYLGSSVSSTENNINTQLAKAWTAIYSYRSYGSQTYPIKFFSSSYRVHITVPAFYYCERVRPFWDHVKEWTARIEPKQLVLLDVGYVIDNVLPPFQGENRVVFHAILAVARMVILSTRS